MRGSRLRRAAAVSVLTAASVAIAGGAALAEPADGLVAEILETAQTGLAAETPEASDGPVVGMPPLADTLRARPEIWTDPAYWSNYVHEILVNGHVNLPYPIDPLKPEAFLPNVPVPKGAYVSALPPVDEDLSGVTYRWQGRSKTVGEFLHTTETDALVFVVDGALVDELYANGFSPEVRHQPWSVTKTFVAAIVGIAADDGLISSLQDPIDAYIPELAGTAWEGVTVENLLQMESGVHWDESTPVLAVNTQVQQWVQLALDLFTDGQLGMTRNEFLMSLPKVYEQGTEFRYNSGNTQVLAWLTEVVYGTTFDEILAEKLWRPMGAAGDAVLTADRTGAVIASHGLFGRSHDFARFGELLRNDGRTPEGRQVVPADWVRAMVTMTEVSGGAYGYQTWAHPIAGDGAYSASGFQGNKVTVVPGDCVTGVRLSHALGGDLRDGDDPTDLTSYGFAIESFGTEWETMLRAVADEVGTCSEVPAPGSSTHRDADPSAGESPSGAAPATRDGGGALPATGGGVAGAAVLLLGTAVALHRGDGESGMSRLGE